MSPLSSIPAYTPSMLPQLDRLPGNDSSVSLPSSLPSALPATAPADNNSFSSLLGKLVTEVNAQQQIAGQNVSALQSGANVPLHQAVISMEEANVSFQLMVQVRNKLLESYQEIMRMQV
jgi:flagellar hook-basal body complex protein FliE